MSEATAQEIKNALRADYLGQQLPEKPQDKIAKRGRSKGERATTKWEKRKKRNRRREQIASRSRRINRIRG